MSEKSERFNYWAMKLHHCNKAHREGLFSDHERLVVLTNIHDLMVDDYYNGAEDVAELIYHTEELLENGIH